MNRSMVAQLMCFVWVLFRFNIHTERHVHHLNRQLNEVEQVHSLVQYVERKKKMSNSLTEQFYFANSI